MADSLGSRPGTSDEYHDPYCEPCEESRGRNVRIEAFCKNCNQYLCIECHTVHGRLKATIGHVIQTGNDMPKSMADKPPRYDTCDDHPKRLKDQFCCDHSTLICSACCSSSHSKCDTKSVADACQYTQQNEVDKLCDVNKAYKSQLLKFLSTVDKHGGKLAEQKKTSLKDAQTAYDKILVEIKRSYQNIKTVIEAECNSQEATVSQTKQEIKAQMSRVDAEINFTNKARSSPINVKTFLSLQESISNTRESAAAIESLKISLNLTSLRFDTSKDIQKLLSEPVTFGILLQSAVNVDVNESVPYIKFPVSWKMSAGAVGTTAQPGRPVPATQASVRSSAGAVGTTAQPGRPVPATEASVRSSAGAVGTTAQPGRPVPATEASMRSSAGAVGTTAQQGRTVLPTEASVRSSTGAVGTTAQPGRPVPATEASVRSSAGAVGTTAQPGRPVPATEASMRSSAGAVGTTAQQGRPRPSAQQASLGQTQATPIGTFKVKTKEDKKICNIIGMAITSRGQRLLVDYNNEKVKLFSQDMRCLSSVSVSGVPLVITMENVREAVDSLVRSLMPEESSAPRDITMVNDREAVVTVRWSLVFLEVTDRQLRVKHTIKLSFDARRITYSRDKLIVTDPTTIHALDLRGTELWSVGQSLFTNARYVCSNSDGRWIAVTDLDKNTVTLLDVNNGAVITSTQLKRSGIYGPRGVSVDTADNIFLCVGPNIVVLSGDLKNEHVLCNLGGKRLQAIAYDDKKHQLLISHGQYQDSVSCLQLS